MRLARWRAERDAFLEAQLEPGESVVARSRDGPMVTDQRILEARQLSYPPRCHERVSSSLDFDQITGWTLGRRHDHRPLLRLEHLSQVRIERVPEHRFLTFEWGNAERPVARTKTTLEFNKAKDPVLVAICERLERAGVGRGEPFVIRPAGTREERIWGHRVPLTRISTWQRGGFWLRRTENRLYRGRLAWRVRIPSWLLLAVPAWFIQPWLVVPAIALVEAAWIASLQWSWHRARDRRGS
jgi:hypothetical protein